MKLFAYLLAAQCQMSLAQYLGGQGDYSTQRTVDTTADAEVAPLPPRRDLHLYSSLGCYGDSPFSRALPIFKGVGKKTGECATLCAAEGYYYFGTQYGLECWCGGTNPLDRGYARHGPSNNCDCESQTNKGININCVYRNWPDQKDTRNLPELNILVPESGAIGAKVNMLYSKEGGENTWSSTNVKGQIKSWPSGHCLSMKAEGGETNLVLASCKETPDQYFELTTDCEGIICDPAQEGMGFTAMCVDGAEGECEDGKIWNFDVQSYAQRTAINSCSAVKNRDSDAPSGLYKLAGYTVDSYCDFNDDDRFRSKQNSAYCLTSSTKDGQRTFLKKCSGSNQMKFVISEEGHIYLKDNGNSCLYVQGSDNGAPIYSGPCGTGNNFKWDITHAGEVKARGSNYCLDIAGGRMTNGVILLWSCHGGLNQKW
eukprot:CAMPEP_0172496702 /NCGR_PEP_ID=MMETSP1066-20121228/91608_1 /TAXON_ID=671091 /ORGANISM="Coscinodiscus wailesii, Strain CCMP2513" /LENGTH=426 /DNA_ID=CAMNT_0013269127 /DNA_START=102 /DNA_END=1379 /DNA_ORIENTATION=-